MSSSKEIATAWVQEPSIWFNQKRMCGQLYQNIFDQFCKNQFLILIKPTMLQRNICKLLRSSIIVPKYTFSNPEKDGVKPQAAKDATKNNEPRQQRSKGQQDDNQQEEIQYQKENRNTIGWWIYRFFFWGSVSLLSYNVYLVANHEKKSKVEDQPGAVPYVIDAAKLVVNNFNEMTEFITQPPSKKLLPDPVHPDLHPKTLVLNLTGTLVKTEYIFGKGNKVIVRPGLETLLQRLVQKYEIIVFAEEDSTFIAQPLNSVDPRHRFISCVLGKQSMVWRGGNYVKDLKYLNRDLRKVVVIDRSKQNVKFHKQNVILLPQFSGDSSDQQMVKLLKLLEVMAGPEVGDVRKYLGKFGEDPLNGFWEKVKDKEKNLKKKSERFGVFGGAKQNARKDANDDDL